MAPDAADVLRSAKALSREEIADLAYHLLQVLEEDDAASDPEEVEGRWRAEIGRRAEEVLRGEVSLMAHREVLDRARARLAEHRG